jgi:hypothetical protein
MLSYDNKWKILADLLKELQKKGEDIPPEILEDLRSTKVMIQILKMDSTHIDTMIRIERYLRKIESYVILTSERLGKEISEMWLRKLKDQPIVERMEKPKKESKFITGIPRNTKYIRIRISDDVTIDEVLKTANENNLTLRNRKNGFIIVYGDKEKIKSFVKKMAKKFHSTKNREKIRSKLL